MKTMRQNLSSSTRFIMILTLCILTFGCNKNNQKVELKSIEIDSLQAITATEKIVLVENRKGEELKIRWPIDTFYAMTGGEATLGMKLEIGKINQEDWTVLKVIPSKKQQNDQTMIIQRVKVAGADMKILVNNIVNGTIHAPLYTGTLYVNNGKGEKVKAFWPENSFYPTTNGIIEKGLSLEITRNLKSNHWTVTNILSKPHNEIQQIGPQQQYLDAKRKIDIEDGHVTVDLKTGLVAYTLNNCRITGFLGETVLDGLLKYKSDTDTTTNTNCIYVDEKTNKPTDIYFTGYFEYSNSFFNNRFIINHIEFGRYYYIPVQYNPVVVQFNVYTDLMEGQTIQLFKL